MPSSFIGCTQTTKDLASDLAETTKQYQTAAQMIIINCLFFFNLFQLSFNQNILFKNFMYLQSICYNIFLY